VPNNDDFDVTIRLQRKIGLGHCTSPILRYDTAAAIVGSDQSDLCQNIDAPSEGNTNIETADVPVLDSGTVLKGEAGQPGPP
jgi:hypothetical protein